MDIMGSSSNLPNERQMEGRKVYTVSAINKRIGDDLKADEMLSDIWVEGEISGLKLHPPSGHYYLTLKDGSSQISCIIFKLSAMTIPAVKTLSDGIMVLSRGDITSYSPKGTYSFRIKDMRIVGRGDLYILFEELKKKLEKEGLFDSARKRQIPPFPRNIGVVTSESGAALQDILNILKRRNPLARIILSPALVQGETAPESIIKAIESLDKSNAEVIIVGRGGGSVEDLWCFNDEKLARTIYRCKVPVISAVGHETDFTIADMVADIRAPTPSAAAEIVAPDILDILRWLTDTERRMTQSMSDILESMGYEIQTMEERIESRNPRTTVEQWHTRCDDLETRMLNILRGRIENLNRDIWAWEERLENSAPTALVKRGFSLLTDRKGELLTKVEDIEVGMGVEIEIADGKITAKVTGVKKNE